MSSTTTRHTLRLLLAILAINHSYARSGTSPRTQSWPVVGGVFAVVLVLTGSGGFWIWIYRRQGTSRAARESPTSDTAAAAAVTPQEYLPLDPVDKEVNGAGDIELGVLPSQQA